MAVDKLATKSSANCSFKLPNEEVSDDWLFSDRNFKDKIRQFFCDPKSNCLPLWEVKCKANTPC